MERLLTTTGLFVVRALAIVSFMAPTAFGQAAKSVETKPLIDEITAAKVDKLFAQWDKPDSPGCALGIIKDGKLIYKRGYGMANLEHSIPITSKSVFDIMSMSKQFTAMSILLLAKQGKLSLDDDIRKYFPELPRYESPITIRHLIHHTSGIRGFAVWVELLGMPQDIPLSTENKIALIARHKELNSKPGDEWAYSNPGYFLLSHIVKKVSGKSLSEFAKQNIFEPLGMTNTQFVVDRTLAIKNRVTGHRAKSNGEFSVSMSFTHQMVDSGGTWGIYSSVEDLFLWDQNFYNNKLGFGPGLIAEQLSSGNLNNGEKQTYAFGLRVSEYEGLKAIGHGGSGGGYESFIGRFPEQNFSVVCLCNADDISASGLANQVSEIFLEDQFKKARDVAKKIATPDVISISEKELAGFTGLYFEPTHRWLNRYFMKDGKLMIQPNFNTGPTFELLPLSRNRFKVVGAPPEIVFVSSPADGSMRTIVISGGKTTGTLDRVQEVTASIRLADFTGKYVSDELPGAVYTVSVRDGKLHLEVRNGISVLNYPQGDGGVASNDIPMMAVFTDAFFTLGGSAVVMFTRNSQNSVSGFTLNKGGVRKLLFIRQ